MVISLYRFEQISYAEVLEMERWRYNGFEKVIYMDRYHESRDRGDDPIRGPRGCHGFSVYNSDNVLFGLFEYYFEEDGVYLGIAINPYFVGRGFSTDYIKEGILHLHKKFTIDRQVKIEVHRRNIQGVKAYEKCGFKLIKRDGEILTYLI